MAKGMKYDDITQLKTYTATFNGSSEWGITGSTWLFEPDKSGKALLKKMILETASPCKEEAMRSMALTKGPELSLLLSQASETFKKYCYGQENSDTLAGLLVEESLSRYSQVATSNRWREKQFDKRKLQNNIRANEQTSNAEIPTTSSSNPFRPIVPNPSQTEVRPLSDYNGDIGLMNYRDIQAKGDYHTTVRHCTPDTRNLVEHWAEDLSQIGMRTLRALEKGEEAPRGMREGLRYFLWHRSEIFEDFYGKADDHWKSRGEGLSKQLLFRAIEMKIERGDYVESPPPTSSPETEVSVVPAQSPAPNSDEYPNISPTQNYTFFQYDPHKRKDIQIDSGSQGGNPETTAQSARKSPVDKSYPYYGEFQSSYRSPYAKPQNPEQSEL